MTTFREIRADYDRATIVVYQAFNPAIADAAVRAQRFVDPFSVERMTWIKPSFLWLMERSGWGTKSNQERILGVRISRTGWERALSLGVLTSFEAPVQGVKANWQAEFSAALVHIQWDPERSLRGAKLEYRSIQVGLSRKIIEEYVQEWTVEIADMTALVAKLRRLREEGRYQDAKRLLPDERIYLVETATSQRLGMRC
jgi:hypothetical protein